MATMIENDNETLMENLMDINAIDMIRMKISYFKDRLVNNPDDHMLKCCLSSSTHQLFKIVQFNITLRFQFRDAVKLALNDTVASPAYKSLANLMYICCLFYNDDCNILHNDLRKIGIVPFELRDGFRIRPDFTAHPDIWTEWLQWRKSVLLTAFDDFNNSLVDTIDNMYAVVPDGVYLTFCNNFKMLKDDVDTYLQVLIEEMYDRAY
jgi:hypothetical protein